MAPTAAQDEFNTLMSRQQERYNSHPEDRNNHHHDSHNGDVSEEDEYRNAQIDAAMRAPAINNGGLRLPPPSFDNGRSTGVKGVIADARSYEAARKTKWKNRVHNARQSIFGANGTARRTGGSGSGSGGSSSVDSDEEAVRSGSDREDDVFLNQWRENRRRELERDSEAGKQVRNRRTSPSMREYGRLVEVDTLGYLDSIEIVGRETTVVVFVYDPECEVSSQVESAILPLVTKHRTVRFVKVHYEDVEFDPAAVPSILAYRNQGDLVANLTGLIEMMPDEEDEGFSSDALQTLLRRYNVL